MTMFFEDFHKGEQFTTVSRTVTESDIVNFAGVSGDFNPIHTDQVLAEKTPYRGRVAHGILTLAVTSGFWSRMGIEGPGFVTVYGIDHLRFTKPVFIGDTITAKILVSNMSERGVFGLVTLHNELINQRNETVLVFDALLLFNKRRPAAENIAQSKLNPEKT